MSDESRKSPPYPPEDGTVELSASDIEPVEPSEAEADTTQVMRRDRIQAHEPLDPPTDEHSLRATAQRESVSEQTTNFDVPAELMEQVIGDDVPTTTKMNAVNTRPMPRVEADATVERPAPKADSDANANPTDGFYTFVARPDPDGRIQLPKTILERHEQGQSFQIMVRAKVNDPGE